MSNGRWDWIVPEGRWEIVEPLLPAAKVRPHGGGTANIDDEAVFAAIVYVLVSGCSWRHLPPCFGASKSTVHRRFRIWTQAGVWGRLHRAILDRLEAEELVDLSRVLLDTSHVRTKKGANTQARAPVDRGKPGSKLHILSETTGQPLVVGVSAGNTHDSHGLIPMVSGLLSRHDPHRGHHAKPRRFYADKAYDHPDLRRWLRGKHITPRIARKGIDSSERLGRYRWRIERTFSWLSGYRRLSPRYERDPRLYLGFLSLAAALTCYKHLHKNTT